MYSLVLTRHFPDSIFFMASVGGLNVPTSETIKIIIMPRQPYVLSQFLHLLPRYEFQRIVNKYRGDYHIKHFRCWDHLACLMVAHIRQEDSLRDIDITLNAHANKLYHIGIKQCPKSTLADANELRDYRIYPIFRKKTELMCDVKRLRNSFYGLHCSLTE